MYNICDPPRDLGYFGVDTRTTRSHGRTKETRFNMEQPCQDISSLKFSFVSYSTLQTKEGTMVRVSTCKQKLLCGTVRIRHGFRAKIHAYCVKNTCVPCQ